MKQNKHITAKEFDERFDKGEDVGAFLDTRKAKKYNRVQRVNIDFPSGLLKEIDDEAKKIGVARTALIKVWLAERLGHA